MQEVFEKILDRLEEDCVSPTDYPGYMVDLEVACNIVKEVAEEFETDTNVGNNRPVQEKEETNTADMCEWREVIGFDYMYIRNPHTNRLYSNEPSMKNIYCNTCGKKIKVVE